MADPKYPIEIEKALAQIRDTLHERSGYLRVITNGDDGKHLLVKKIPCELSKKWKQIPLAIIDSIEQPGNGEDKYAYCLLARHPIVYIKMNFIHDEQFKDILSKCFGAFKRGLSPKMFTDAMWNNEVHPRASLAWAHLLPSVNLPYLLEGAYKVGKYTKEEAQNDPFPFIRDYDQFDRAMRRVHRETLELHASSGSADEFTRGMWCDEF
jgi:hypothetical protein